MDSDEYPSESDASDEDFCVDKEVHSASEVETDDDLDNDSDDKETSNTTKSRKRKITSKSQSKKVKLEVSTEISSQSIEIDNGEDEKKHADSLWAAFLSDTGTSTKSAIESPKEEILPKATSVKRNVSNVNTSEKPKVEKRTVTEIFDYAGEVVKVTKEVEIVDTKTPGSSCKGKTGGSKLGEILNQIGKKNKISTIEKTKLDWNSFKRNEGLEEEIQTFNKGKHGYLERQDFLERADLRQFEIEKSLRNTSKRSTK